MKVFVYGSLRAGFGNHGLLEGSEYVGKAFTAPAFTMLHLGGFPGIVQSGGTSIVGEVYKVDDDTLRNLDRLEGHPSFYERRQHVVDLEGNLETVSMYVLPDVWLDGNNKIVESGDWAAARNRKDLR
jgi:gamma-glutamylaminecyclotransferase